MDNRLESWIAVAPAADFPIQNLPFGIFHSGNQPKRAATIIGDTVIDLGLMASKGFFNKFISDPSVLNESSLNSFIALGKPVWKEMRESLTKLFDFGNPEIRENESLCNEILHEVKDVQLHMPISVPNYTDFYSSIEHATNVGIMFRGKENALMPNWKHLPVGYHGRASSICVSGVNFKRPKGQMNPDDTQPVFGLSKQLDFELEIAFVVGKPTELGDSVKTAEAEDHIFGMLLFNDWSARDIQKWEYVPLGPFLGKNFFSSVSPWIVTMDALEPFRVAGPVQEPPVLPYLQYAGDKNFDINLDVYLKPGNTDGVLISKSNFKYMYWNMAQQLAHHTVNGCNICVGDLYASGTISGPTEDSFGSMLEISWKGTKAVPMPDGTERKFLLDGDSIIIHGYCEKDNFRIGFGQVRNKVLPAASY